MGNTDHDDVGPVKVTVTDPVTEEVLGSAVIEDDYVLICQGRRYLASNVAYGNGTVVLTLKLERA